MPLGGFHRPQLADIITTLQSSVELCLTQKSVNAPAAALMSTWGPLERRPDRGFSFIHPLLGGAQPLLIRINSADNRRATRLNFEASA